VIGLKSLRLDLVSPVATYEAFFDRSRAGLPNFRIGGPLGLDGYFRVDENATEQPRAAKGRWLTDTRFQIVSQSILEGIVTNTTLTFQSDQVDVEVEDNHGVRGRFQGESKD
jgi:hypothetical protein